MAHIDINFISNALGRAVDVTLILPTKTSPELVSSYGRKDATFYQKKKNQKYPLLILLHGLLNDHNSWTRYARAEFFAEENNIAIAMINGENKFYKNMDTPYLKTLFPGFEGNNMSDQFYDFIELELKDFLYGTFPISKKKEDNYIAGLSMGGFGALYHGLKNPKAYAAIGAFSAPLHEGMGLHKLVKKNVKYPSIYMSIGTNDFLLQGNQSFSTYLKDRNISVEYHEISGYTHEWRFWDMELEKFIKGLKRSDVYAKDLPRKV